MSNTVVITDAPAGARHDLPPTYFPSREDVVDWQERFKRDDDRFHTGELVAANVTVVCQPGLPPEFHVRSQGCAKDIFVPLTVTVDDVVSLRGLARRTGTALVSIVDAGDEIHIGHYYTVDAVELALTPLNPSHEEILAMPGKTPVTIEGEVIRTHPGSWDLGHFKNYERAITIRGTNGVEYIVNSKMKMLQFEDGVYENLSGRNVMIGEKIRLSVTAVDSSVPVLDGEFSHAYLLEPHYNRRTEYEALRRQVDHRLDRLEEAVRLGRTQAARSFFAIIHNMELTAHEREHLYETIGQLVEHERPVYETAALKYRYATSAMRKVYNADIETMNKSQFRDFAERVAHGTIAMNEGETDREVDRVIGLMDSSDLFSDDEVINYASTVIESVLRRVRREEYEKDKLRGLSSALYTAIRRLARRGIVTDRVLSYLLTLGDHAIENGYFEKGDGTERPLEDMADTVFDTIRAVFVTDAKGGHYERALEVVPLLRGWVEELEEGGAWSFLLRKVRTLVILRPDVFNY